MPVATIARSCTCSSPLAGDDAVCLMCGRDLKPVVSTIELLRRAYPYRPVVKLPHGSHGLSREQVKANQRTRIFAALTECIRVRGADRTAVAHIVELAGVSRRAFYEQFPNVRDCIAQAIREAQK